MCQQFKMKTTEDFIFQLNKDIILKSRERVFKKEHIQKYLDEFRYQMNRSTYKETILDLLTNRTMNTQKILYQDITTIK